MPRYNFICFWLLHTLRTSDESDISHILIFSAGSNVDTFLTMMPNRPRITGYLTFLFKNFFNDFIVIFHLSKSVKFDLIVIMYSVKISCNTIVIYCNCSRRRSRCCGRSRNRIRRYGRCCSRAQIRLLWSTLTHSAIL